MSLKEWLSCYEVSKISYGIGLKSKHHAISDLSLTFIGSGGLKAVKTDRCNNVALATAMRFENRRISKALASAGCLLHRNSF
jgi:hypothetical protein